MGGGGGGGGLWRSMISLTELLALSHCVAATINSKSEESKLPSNAC